MLNTYKSILDKYSDINYYDNLYNHPVIIGSRNAVTNKVMLITTPLYDDSLPDVTTKVLSYINLEHTTIYELTIPVHNLRKALNKIQVLNTAIDLYAECKSCQGTCEVAYIYNYNNESYSVTEDCPVCGGTGKVLKKLPILPVNTKDYIENEFIGIRNLTFRPHYIEVILDIADTLKLDTVIVRNEQDTSMLFSIGDVDILLCRLNLVDIPRCVIHVVDLSIYSTILQ